MSIDFENIMSGMNATLLWENPNPNSSFGDFEVTINNITDYDYLLAIAKETTTINKLYKSLIEVDLNRVFGANTTRILLQPISSIWTNDTNSIMYGGRQVEFNKDTKIMKITRNWDFGEATVHNDRNIPLKIYGLKGKVLGVRGGVILKLLKHLTRKWGV